MRKANLRVVLLSLLAVGLAAIALATANALADEPAVIDNNSLTAEQKTALAAVAARLVGVEALAAKIDDPAYKAEVARQLAELKKSQLAIERNFDQGAYDALMHSVISRYQVIGLWLKAPSQPLRL